MQWKLYRETLANLSTIGHLRGFSDQPVAEIVQCGEPFLKARIFNELQIQPFGCIELPQPKLLMGVQQPAETWVRVRSDLITWRHHAQTFNR